MNQKSEKTSTRIVKFNYFDEDGLNTFYINLDRAQVIQQEGKFTLHFELDQEDKDFDPEYPMEGDEADLEFEGVINNMSDYLNKLPCETELPFPNAKWKNWMIVGYAVEAQQLELVGYW